METIKQPAVKAKILLVEDEDNALSAMTFILNRNGYMVAPVSSGEEALAILKVSQECGTHVDVIVTDLMMPTMSGEALIREIRRQGLKIPTVVITGFIQTSVLDEIHNLGVEQVLFKPFADTELVEAIEAVMKGCKAQSA